MTPAALPPAPPAPFGVVYSVPALVVFFVLVIALLVLPAVADRTAAKVAQWIWLAAVLDVIFELALVAIAAVVGLGSGIEGLWAGAGRRDFVLDASLYVLVIAVLRRKVDNYIDGGGGGFGVGHDDDPPSSGGGVASSLLLHRVLISVPRGPLTPLSSRAPLIRAIERTAKQVATDRATGTATAGGTRAPAQ